MQGVTRYPRVKEVRMPTFVVRHKKSQDLYSEERHQLKTIKNMFRIGGPELAPSLHVRKYQNIKDHMGSPH